MTQRRRIIPRLGFWLAAVTLSIGAGAAYAQPDGPIHEYLTREEALLEVFPKSTTYLTDVIELSAQEVSEVEEALFRKLDSPHQEVIRCYDAGGKFLGYAVISEESGKYRPITYIVGIDPSFEVSKVAVMVYREDRGGEVQTPRFLYQYEGKSLKDPLRVNRDIVNISGATISVRAISAGVKKALYLVDDYYRSHPPAAVLSGNADAEHAEQ